MDQPLLDIKNLSTAFSFRGSWAYAVRDVNLRVNSGKIVGIVGESGSGKSILMKSVLGLLPPSAAVRSGEIFFEGQDLLALKETQRRALRGHSLAMVFQDPMTALNPLRTVGFHLEEILRRQSRIRPSLAHQQAIELLVKVGIPIPEKRLRQYPHTLSGGMRQRVLIAMALACQPNLLIADEPTTALDVTIQAQILQLLKQIQGETGMSILLITHNLGIVAQLCDEVAVLYGGYMMERGTTEEIFYTPQNPYTCALLQALPNVEEIKGTRLTPIPGRAPALLEPAPGCPFAPRCEHCEKICLEKIPPEFQIGDSHTSRCFFSFTNQTKTLRRMF